MVYYDQIHLYAENVDQDKYKSLINEMNGIIKQVRYDVLKVSNDQILDVKNVHKKVLSFVSPRRFGNNPFISRMFQPLGQNQTFTVPNITRQ